MSKLPKTLIQRCYDIKKLLFYTNMSNIDEYSFNPFKDDESQFYFIINVDGDDVKFYQSGEYPNVFSDEDLVQVYIFTPKNRKNVELHIINDTFKNQLNEST